MHLCFYNLELPDLGDPISEEPTMQTEKTNTTYAQASFEDDVKNKQDKKENQDDKKEKV